MNTEKAIDLLERNKAGLCHDCMHPQMVGWCENHCGLPEAFDMAIEALKAQSDGDTISRKAAIDAFKPYADYESNRTNADWVLRIELVLHDLPSAQPEPQWIPVAERLPENKQEVLVTEYGDTDIGRRFNGRWLDRYGDKMKDVTAWMEKPEPYAERRTDG